MSPSLPEVRRDAPDEEVRMHRYRHLMIGLSREAPSLVQRLQGSKLWRAPSLTGALMPDPASGRDRFTLTAELPSTGKPAPAAAPRTEDADGR